ncbi:MAG: flagellar hook-associated protein FlgK [Terriglobia bacterium]|nr:MAG: flagellar hook-associated protein FlgK [Terriglobia bacterium]
MGAALRRPEHRIHGPGRTRHGRQGRPHAARRVIMANLLAVLLSSANALDAYSRVLEVTQNNVTNASTPGYAKQSLTLLAKPFDVQSGASGGVTIGQLLSARNIYAERAVQQQNTGLGREQQSVNSLTALQNLFDISGTTGLPYALNQFFQSASSWGQTPSNEAARQNVIARATNLAQTFQNTAGSLQNLTHNTETQMYGTVDQINHLVGQIQAFNHHLLQTGSQDSGIESQISSILENLSQYAAVTAVKQSDGTTTILMNDDTPLLVGDHQFKIRAGLSVSASAANPDAPPLAYVVAADGTDVTPKTTDGQLGALLDMRNRVLPSYLGDGSQPGDLNRMAQQFADRVNQLLTSGIISDGPPPVPGVPLFTYDTANPTNVARSLAVDPAVTGGQLAAITPGPPYVSNGVPLTLSQMATPSDPADEIDGVSFTEFYGNMAAGAGSELQQAQNGEQVQQALLAQARDQRQQLQGVSLDEEATILVEFQRAYQANSRLITVLDELTQATIDILR